MPQGAHRAMSDRYAEVALSRLLNEATERGFVLTRLPGRNGVWIVNIGGAAEQHTADTIGDAVSQALEKNPP